MDDLLQLTIMYDMYSPLLTQKQRDVFELYYMDNLSFQEIAEIQNVSKASVFDLINRTKSKIFDYEDKLKLYEKYNIEKGMLEDIESELNILDIKKLETLKNKFDKYKAYISE